MCRAERHSRTGIISMNAKTLKQTKTKFKSRAYDTGDSQAVSDPSTNPAQRCLTCEIGRDRVCSAWYGRRRAPTLRLLCSLLKQRTRSHRPHALLFRSLSHSPLIACALAVIGCARFALPIPVSSPSLLRFNYPSLR